MLLPVAPENLSEFLDFGKFKIQDATPFHHSSEKNCTPMEENNATDVFSNTGNCKREDARKGVVSSFGSSS